MVFMNIEKNEMHENFIDSEPLTTLATLTGIHRKAFSCLSCFSMLDNKSRRGLRDQW